MDNLNQDLHYLYEKDHWWFRTRRAVIRNIIKYSKLNIDSLIFEIGCGTGGNFKYLFNDYNNLYGLEINSYAIEIAKINNPKANFIAGDANDFKKINITADLIIFLDVLYSKNIINVKDVLIKSRNHVKNNGYLLISEPAFNFLKGKHSDSVNSLRRFNLKDMEKKITSCGYKIIKSQYWGFSIFFFMFLKRYIFERFSFKKTNNFHNEFLIPNSFNKIFFFLQKFELFISRKFKFPFGSSILILAKKI